MTSTWDAGLPAPAPRARKPGGPAGYPSCTAPGKPLGICFGSHLANTGVAARGHCRRHDTRSPAPAPHRWPLSVSWPLRARPAPLGPCGSSQSGPWAAVEWAGGVPWFPRPPRALPSEDDPAPGPPPPTTLQHTLLHAHAHTRSHMHFLFSLFAANCLLGDAGGCASGKAQLALL